MDGFFPICTPFPSTRRILRMSEKDSIELNLPSGILCGGIVKVYDHFGLCRVSRFHSYHRIPNVLVSRHPLILVMLTYPYSRLDIYSDCDGSPTAFPNLEALATDFLASLDPFLFVAPNLKHLVQVSSNFYDQQRFCTTLLKLMASLSQPVTSRLSLLFSSLNNIGSGTYNIRRIESITITELPWLSNTIRPEKESEEGLFALQKLDRYCKKNEIHIYGHMGKRHCCVHQAWAALVHCKDYYR